jgi:cardiolipin synthase A/B
VAALIRRVIFGLAREGGGLEGQFRFSSGARAGQERLDRAGPDAPNNDVTLLVDGAEMFPALRDALGSARRSICLQTFIYTDDSTGRSVARLLCQKAREGVKVRLMIDNVGDKLGRELERELKDAGVEVIIQHGWGEGIKESIVGAARGLWNGLRGLFGGKTKPREGRGLLNHDHRKITVVDGVTGFCGGMNIAREYEHDWHDIHAVVRGSAVAKLEEMFFERWRAAGGEGQPLPPEASPSWPGTMAVDVVGALPGLSTAIKDRYLAEIAACRDRALLENAYFLDDDIIHALQAAARRSVRTVVILPGDAKHDVPAVRDAFAWVQNDVVRSGVEVYKYRDRMVHSKVASFDGRLATVGSSNLDNMALTKLAEVNLFVLDRGFARTMEERIFSRDIPNSDRQQETRLSWWEKVKGATLNFVRGIL